MSGLEPFEGRVVSVETFPSFLPVDEEFPHVFHTVCRIMAESTTAPGSLVTIEFILFDKPEPQVGDFWRWKPKHPDPGIIDL